MECEVMPTSVYMTSFGCATPGCINILYDTSGFKRSWKSKTFCNDCIQQRKNEASKRCRVKKNGKN